MNADTLAIGLFLCALGVTLTLSALALGLTLFKDEQPAVQAKKQAKKQAADSFWLDRLIAIQKPEYRRFSYVLYGLALACFMAGGLWLIFQSR